MQQSTGAVIGVVGGSGGVGASTFAAVLAAVAAPAVLVDLDPVGGGIDVRLGIEQVPGARWSGLRVDGGRLESDQLAEGLPWWRSVAVLAVDSPPPPAAVEPVLDAAAALGAVLVDLPRHGTQARADALAYCAFVVLVAAAEVRELAAARAVLASMPDVPAGLVLRRGPITRTDAVEMLGVPLLAMLPSTGSAELDGPRLPRRLERVATGVLDGVAL